MTEHRTRRRRAQLPALAAAHVEMAVTAPPASPPNPHAPDPPPTIFELTPAQSAFLRTLHFLSEYEIKHLHKAPDDVDGAFTTAAVAAIRANTVLGGAERADRIQSAVEQEVQLAALAEVLGPLARLVGQNLLAVRAQLAREAGEPLKVAHALERTQPALLQALAPLAAWAAAHHHRSAPQPPPAAPATPEVQ